jgi:adenylate cyclase
MTESRKLAAILVADVVGFSRLAGADEDRTLARLRALRSDLIDPTISVHKGRVVKRTGDGVLVEFRSVVDAVRCAIEMQNAMVERNAGLPAGRRIEFRIGIHLGDVVEESDGDLMGDGVNIAARLEGIAQPGAICLSEDAYRQVKSRLDLAISDLGETKLKNIAEPLRVYSLQVGVAAHAAAQPQATKSEQPWTSVALPNKPSIAVLPFTNMSGDPEQEYFSDGITEDIITELSRFNSLSVIARNSSFSFKGRSVDIAEVGRTLGVRYVVEGSVRKAGQRVRITAQLIEAAAGRHVWAERYDRDLKDIFAVQDEVTERIVWALTGKVAVAEIARSKRQRVENLEAYDLVLRGTDLLYRYTAEATATAIDLIKRASELDPNTGWILSWLASAYMQAGFLDYDEGKFDLAVETAERALALGDAEDWTDSIVAYIAGFRRNSQEAEIRLSRALARNPHAAWTIEARIYVLLWQGQTGKAREIAERVVSLDPINPLWFHEFLASANYLLGDYEGSLRAFKQCMPVGYYRSYAHFAACLGQLGHVEEAQTAWRRCLELRPGFTVEEFDCESPYQLRQDRERWLEGLRKAGLPD